MHGHGVAPHMGLWSDHSKLSLYHGVPLLSECQAQELALILEYCHSSILWNGTECNGNKRPRIC